MKHTYRSSTTPQRRKRALGLRLGVGLLVALLAACNGGSEDFVKPAINLYNPIPDAHLSGQGWQIAGKVADNHQAARLAYRINDGQEREVSLEGLAEFRFGFNLQELKPGKNTLTLTATDQAGNTNTRVLEFKYAAATTAPPTITLSSPAPDSLTQTNTVRLIGSASDDVSVTRMAFQLNNEPEEPMAITPGKSVSFDHTAGFLSPGANTLRLIAYDGNGNRSLSSLTVHYGSRWDPLESTCRHASLSIL